MKKNIILVLFLIGLLSCKQAHENNTISEPEIKPITYSFTKVKGIGFEQGITRRDPSDVIQVDGIYYVYYTKVLGMAPGYWGDLWYATSSDGIDWNEQGQVLGLGKEGMFDSQAVFTPNIIKSENAYYLFYTGVKPTPGRNDGVFENNSTTDITALGLAVSDKPGGPFKRVSNQPILEVSQNPEKFDSYRIDDAALLFRDNKYFLYYKGRSRKDGKGGPAHTQMGVAISDKPEGPYIKYGDPLLDKSHEVLIWKQGKGVAALASISSTLEYSHTGLDFLSNRKSLKVEKRPFAPGAFRPDLTGVLSDKLEWGISMVHNGPDCYLIRYDVQEHNFLKGTYGFDREFLQTQYEKTIVLESENKKASIIVSPELQGRVMTSSLNGDDGMSFGWINHDLIASKEVNNKFNPFGGEERFWLGPEGGQFSIFFKPNTTFGFENWHVPSFIDTDPFEVVERHANSASFKKEIAFINHSATEFNLDINRKVTLLDDSEIANNLQLSNVEYSAVAYESQNTVKNIGEVNWNEDSGLVSIWILCMLNPSTEVTVVAPINQGSEEELGVKVNDNYFGKVDANRLVTSEQTVFFKADGKSRGKIGLTPNRATKYIGSYDAENKVLTILEIKAPKKTDKYVNSAWELQEFPFSGDVINSYNDGPLEDGSQMGPFYELESSSPALALKPNESYTHIQRMYHFSGTENNLDTISKQLLNVSLEDIQNAFKN